MASLMYQKAVNLNNTINHKLSKAILYLSLVSSSILSAGVCAAEHNLLELDIEQVQKKVRDGSLTYTQLTEFYLDRINKLDQAGPSLNSIISINQQAVKLAKQKDRELKNRMKKGLLHGIPVVLKDNIETSGNMPTTAGALALKNNFAKQDAFLVKKLKDAGAIILAKSSLSEWANFKSTNSSSGYSDINGQTKNPYVLNRTPCGSSSGTGVAVAANLAIAGIGTETDGSITCPSAHNSLVGLKPTVGLVSRRGVVPLSHSQDSPGPMTRTVSDAAIMLTVLAQADPKDKKANPQKSDIDYTKHLIKDGLKGKRIGIVRSLTGFNETSNRYFEQSLKLLKAQGAIIVDNLELPHQEELGGAEFDVLLHDFKHDVNEYLANTSEQVPVKSLSELITFNQNQTSHYSFNQALLTMANQKGSLTSDAYIKAQAVIENKGRKQGIDLLLNEHNLDAIVAPTNGPAWNIDTVNGDNYTGASSMPSAVAGYPTITVPMAYHRGLPLGLSFFGGAYSEGKLLEIAYGFEQTNKIRVSPKFITSIDL